VVLNWADELASVPGGAGPLPMALFASSDS
jgi:hypothetical protein